MAKKDKQKGNKGKAQSKPEVKTDEAAVHIQVQSEAPDGSPNLSEGTKSTGGPTVVKKAAKKGLKPTHLWIIVLVAGGLLIGGATWVGMEIFGNSDSPSASSGSSRRDTSNLSARKLDGVFVTPGQENPNLYAVMIENLTSSRPPSGLDKASVVYEALAEGGITRFMAIIPVGVDSSEIGPVRSARRYYLAWADEYNKPLYIHVGGSPNALSYLGSSQSNVVDFNQFRHATNFWRDSSRSAPHNLYTSTDRLFLGLKEVAPELVPDYEGWPFKNDSTEVNLTPTAPEIVIDYSSINYRTTYKYHPELNRYFRFHGDSEHVTRDGEKIWAKNVIVMFMQTGLLPGESQRLDMKTEGEGRTLVFRDGEVVEGTWKKDSSTSRTQFLDANSQPIALNRGPIWISVVPTDREVTYLAPKPEAAE